MTYVAGKIGQGGNFDGSTGFITVADNAVLQLTSFSISCWVKRANTTATGNDMILFTKQSDSGLHENYFLRIGRGGDLTNGFVDFGFYSTGASYSILATASALVNDTNYHHIVVIFSGGTGFIYIDGVQVATGAMAGTPLAGAFPMFIGCATQTTYQSGRFFQGILDEIGLWNVALTQGQVLRLYNGIIGLTFPFASGNFEAFV